MTSIMIPGTNRDTRIASVSRFLHQAMPGKKLLVEVKAYSPKRSNSLNSYYWGVVVKTIAEATGYESPEVHEILAKKFLPPKVVEIAGERHAVRAQTAKLPTVEFQGYIEAIKRWAAQELEGLYIPDPNEYREQA